jgi:ankyrin repeat protein
MDDYDSFGDDYDSDGYYGTPWRGGEPWRPAIESGSLQQLRDLVQADGLAVLTENVLHYDGPTETTPLLEAVINRHVDMVRYLLEDCSSVVDVNASCYEDDNKEQERGFTALHFATLHDNLDLVRYLVEKGCDVNAVATGVDDKMALHIAVCEGHVGIAKFLIDTGLCNMDLEMRDGSGPATPLYLAVVYENLELVQYILERGPWTEEEKVDRGTKVWTAASEKGKWDVSKYLVKYYLADIDSSNALDPRGNSTPLLIACAHGCLDTLRYLVETCHVKAKEYCGNDRDSNPLFQACESGYLEIVQYLIEKCDAKFETPRGGTVPARLASWIWYNTW